METQRAPILPAAPPLLDLQLPKPKPGVFFNSRRRLIGSQGLFERTKPNQTNPKNERFYFLIELIFTPLADRSPLPARFCADLLLCSSSRGKPSTEACGRQVSALHTGVLPVCAEPLHGNRDGIIANHSRQRPSNKLGTGGAGAFSLLFLLEVQGPTPRVRGKRAAANRETEKRKCFPFCPL